MGYFSYLSPITVNDIASHSDYVNTLIAMYSDLIDEYRFDRINWEMLTSAAKKSKSGNMNINMQLYITNLLSKIEYLNK